MPAALAIAGLLGWMVWKIPAFESKPSPAGSFDEALAIFDKLRSAESSLPLSPSGASRLLHHGQKTERAFVLLHGLTNCPEQFASFATQIHAAGHNVVIPRARLAGFRDRLNGEQGLQSAQDLIDQAAAGLDIAAGLGERVTLVGLSGSAVAAARHRRRRLQAWARPPAGLVGVNLGKNKEGDAVRDVLSYVHYDLARLFGEVRRECEKAVVNKQMTVAESQGLLKAYEAGLSGYTYLETESR